MTCCCCLAALLGTFLIVFVSQGVLFFWVIHYKKQRRAAQAIQSRLCNRQLRDMSTCAGVSSVFVSKASDLGVAETTVSRIHIHWDAFKDNVRTTFTVVIICSTYILGFIFGAAMGTGLALAYRKELVSRAAFVDLNIYLWTVEATIYMICFPANPYVYGLRNNDITEEFRSAFAKLNPIPFIRSTFRLNSWSNTRSNSKSQKTWELQVLNFP